MRRALRERLSSLVQERDNEEARSAGVANLAMYGHGEDEEHVEDITLLFAGE